MPVTDERGAVAIMVAVSLTVLLGVGALVLDVGALYVERRELQNGADAAALAIAEDCALDNDDCDDHLAAAAAYADANAHDGVSNVDDVDLDMDDREVTVATSTESEDGNQIEFGFARIFGIDGSTVKASASAGWFVPQKIEAVPITISVSEYKPKSHVVLCFKSDTGPDCADGFGGSADGPGAFGYVESSGCRALNQQGDPVEVEDKAVDVDHGNDGPKNLGCVAANDFEPLPSSPDTPRIVFLPVHDKLAGGRYSIVGFAAIEVDGFKFTGDHDEWCWSFELPITCGGNGRWLSGTFVNYVVRDVVKAKPNKSAYTGVAVIELTK
jgi:hypothetical protein